MIKGIMAQLYPKGELEFVIEEERGIKPLQLIPFSNINIFMVAIFPPEPKLLDLYKKARLDVCVVKCEKYQAKENRARQCMKCLDFGHIARNCEHKEIPTTKTVNHIEKCSLCESTEHNAKSKLCPVKGTNMEKATEKQ